MKILPVLGGCLAALACSANDPERRAGAGPASAAPAVVADDMSRAGRTRCPQPTEVLFRPPLPTPGFIPAPPAGARIAPPRRLLGASPVWPSASLSCHEQGVVTVTYCVSASGEVENAQVLISSGYARLDNAVLAWVARDRHTAGTVDGQPRRYCGLVAEQRLEDKAEADGAIAL